MKYKIIEESFYIFDGLEKSTVKGSLTLLEARQYMLDIIKTLNTEPEVSAFQEAYEQGRFKFTNKSNLLKFEIKADEGFYKLYIRRDHRRNYLNG